MSGTGYTYPVIKGEITNFRDFALSCARAFGALITMRDDPKDKPIPEVIEPSTEFYDESIARLEAEVARVTALSDEQCVDEQRAVAAEVEQHNRDILAEAEAENARLAAMKATVEQWTPPTIEHQGLKEFMLQQISISGSDPLISSVPEMLPPSEWRACRLKQLHEELQRYQRSRREEIERAAGRTKWIADLRASLEPKNDRSAA